MNVSVAIKIPEVGESISEVSIGEWLKHEGDLVERDEDIVVIETDKATVEVPAPEAGRVVKILKNSGDTASVNEVIAYIDESAADAKAKDGSAQAEQAPPSTRAAESQKPSAAPPPVEEKTETKEEAPQPPRAKTPTRVAEPATEQPTGAPEAKSEEAGMLDSLQPGREAPVRQVKTAAPESSREKLQSMRPKKEPVAPARAAERREDVVPMSQFRRRIAERLVHAQQSAALLTTFNEIEMTAVIELRRKYRDVFTEKHGVKLGFMSFFAKAAVGALKLVPEVNAEIRGDNIVYRNFFDIGIAVGGGKGLVVPVLRDAEALSFAAIEKTIADFARRAEENKLKPEELQGGTFTISNGGVYGSLLSTPIVNPPQSAILGLHAIEERPVARGGVVVIRSMMYVALSYDHRIIDGREAVTFLKRIKDLVEDPTRLLFEI
jgi:2-oxoglutarate dehydrogenase E2 component (dihydrolipoamide succinyltransferase)